MAVSARHPSNNPHGDRLEQHKRMWHPIKSQSNVIHTTLCSSPRRVNMIVMGWIQRGQMMSCLVHSSSLSRHILRWTLLLLSFSALITYFHKLYIIRHVLKQTASFGDSMFGNRPVKINSTYKVGSHEHNIQHNLLAIIHECWLQSKHKHIQNTIRISSTRYKNTHNQLNGRSLSGLPLSVFNSEQRRYSSP